MPQLPDLHRARVPAGLGPHRVGATRRILLQIGEDVRQRHVHPLEPIVHCENLNIDRQAMPSTAASNQSLPLLCSPLLAFVGTLAKEKKAELLTSDPKFKPLEGQIKIRWLKP